MRRSVLTPIFTLLVLFVCAGAAAAQTISMGSLLKEMIDRDRLARFPDPAYTCKQFSSYDRASTSAADKNTWFANGDAGKFIRVEKNPKMEGGEEFVMMEAEGPGAIVRFWSANPTGTVRFYIDGAAEPALTVPLADYLGGKWKVGAPLSEMVSRGWNNYFPIPYAKSIRVTQEGKRIKEKDNEYNECYRTYYQINYRTYPTGTKVESFTQDGFDRVRSQLEAVQQALSSADRELADMPRSVKERVQLKPGESRSFDLPPGPGAVTLVSALVGGSGDSSSDLEQALRSLVLSMEFDGEQTVWCPVGDFFSSGVGSNRYSSWHTSVLPGNEMVARWVMPYRSGGKVTLTNTGHAAYSAQLALATKRYDKWDDALMHFHTAWRYEYPIHAEGAHGTEDWNYLEVNGKGVYVGDALSVMNPVSDWWGEGDEKIYVDGETFPSHFGTGTEDYYGYAWCWPEFFNSPFHAQPRVDGQKDHNNHGYTTVMRSRSLDAIPFTKSFKFDIEVWHWKKSDIVYAATTQFYAMPGATTNRKPQPEDSGRDIVQPPPPFRVPGAIEAEQLKVVSHSEGTAVGPQGGFGPDLWSGGVHLWVQGRKAGDFVEVEIPAGGDGPVDLVVYATRSWDYGIVRFSVDGKQLGKDIDMFNSKGHAVASTGPLDLGVVAPHDGKIRLRAEVVGGNPKSEGTKSFFGIDCVVLKPAR
jgi:hypothetical protein